MKYEEFKEKSGRKIFDEELKKLENEIHKLETELKELLESYELFDTLKILEEINVIQTLIIGPKVEKQKQPDELIVKKLAEDYRKFQESIQHLSASKYESVLNIIKKAQQINKKIITLGKDTSDLQYENIESVQEENESQSTYQSPKAIEEQKSVEEIIDQQKLVVEEPEEESKQDINNISNETTQEEFFIDWEYVKNLGLMGQWEKRAEYFENLASKIKIASNSSNKNLVPVPIWEDRSPALIDERYAEIFKTCYIEYEKAKKCDELSKSQPNDTKEKIQEESFEGIDFKKMGSMSLQERKHYLLVYMSKIIKNPAKIENPYLISFGDKVYTIDKKYAEVFNQCKDLIIQIQKEETRAKIEEISKIAEDYVNLKNKIMHRISISNMDHYNYESQKDKEEMEAIINDVNKYLHLQGRLKYFMKDPKDHHLLETPFDVDKLFATYERFNKNNVKPEEQKNLNTYRVPIRTEKFKINWKEIARLSIKDKIETLEQAMIAMINAPKENTTSVNVDDTSYSINKKDEKVFNKCYKEYQKIYFPVYNNNFSAKFPNTIFASASNNKEVKPKTFETNENIENPFQKVDKIFENIKNKIGFGIKAIKALPESLSNTIMKRVQLGTVKVKAGTYNMLDENIYREENRYGR